MDQRSAEEQIFNLQKKIDTYLRAGDVAEVSRLQQRISQLQREHGAVKGAGRDEHDDRTA